MPRCNFCLRVLPSAKGVTLHIAHSPECQQKMKDAREKIDQRLTGQQPVLGHGDEPDLRQGEDPQGLADNIVADDVPME
jgi:hypothetical protein